MKHNIKNIQYKLILLITLLVCIFPHGIMQAQTYPVQANVYLSPPYSNYLSDYYSTSKEKLIVTLLNRDQQKPVLEVRLRLSITAVNGLKIQNREEINYPTITLDAGVPVRLSQEDLSPYFQPHNILTQGSLIQGKLPEGLVEFTFQAIEKYTGKVLSAPATGRVWLTSQKPPILRLPSNDDNIAFRDPLNIKFQWEPQHKNISQVEYEFELRELPNNGAAPQSSFMYAPVIYQERLLYTYLMYTVIMPPLDPDKTYGWRVRAIAKDGVDELNMFENGGYSEIFWFRTTSYCQPPADFQVELKDRSLNLAWFPAEGNKEFVLQYRLKNDVNAKWQESKTYENHINLYGLQRGGTYEYRVGSICNSGQPVFTNTQEITVSAVDSTRLTRCGIPGQFNLDNKEPLPELKAGDVVMVNDYPMTVTQASGGSGSFSGEGWLPVNWLLNTKWQVEFSNIKVNTDYRLIGGSIKAKYDPNESQIAKVNEITKGGHDNTRQGITLPDVTVDFSVPANPNFAYDPQKEEMTVYSTNGTAAGTVDLKNQNKEAFPLTIKDKDGNLYQVDQERDPDGKPTAKEGEAPKLNSTYLGKQGQALSEGSFNPQALSPGTAVVSFSNSSQSVYALDTWKKEYERIVDIRKKYDKLGNTYYTPWKFLPTGASDKVIAMVEIENKTLIHPDSILFTTPQGIRFEAQTKDGQYFELTIASGQPRDVQEIYALYPVKGSKSKYYTLGKLNVVTYDKQENKLVVIQVNSQVDQNTLQKYLDDTYNPVGVKWNVEVQDFDYKGNTAGFFDKKTGAWNAYNTQMDELIAAYKAEKGTDAKTSYLFILDNSGSTQRDASGFMPRGKQFGFIFTKDRTTDQVNNIIAHELGHGRWRLPHTFDSTYGGEMKESSTDNLMDYSSGTHLAKWQWEQITDPAWFTNPFDGDEKGMFAGKYALSPDYKVISIPNSNIIYTKNIKQRTVYEGTLPAFVVEKDGVQIAYIWNGTAYANEGNPSDIYPVKYIDKPANDAAVHLIYNLKEACGNRFYITTQYKEIKDAINGSEAQADIAKIITTLSSKKKEIVCTTSDITPQEASVWKSQDIPAAKGSSVGNVKDFSNSLTQDNISQISDIVTGYTSYSEKELTVYVLDSQAPDYQDRLKEAQASSNHAVFVVNQSKEIELKTFNLEAPDWLVEYLPDLGTPPYQDCWVDYINQNLKALHETSGYKRLSYPEKLIYELNVLTFSGMLGTWKCVTSEQAMKNREAGVQFFGGVVNIAVDYVDIPMMIVGLNTLSDKKDEAVQQSFINYAKGIKNSLKQVIKDPNHAGKTELIKNILYLPPARLQDAAIGLAINIGKYLGSFYSDCDSVGIENDTYNLCPYRYGQTAAIVVPLVISGGEMGAAWISKTKYAGYLGSFNKAERVTAIVENAIQEGNSVECLAANMVIRDRDGVQLYNLTRNGKEVEIVAANLAEDVAKEGKIVEGILDDVPLITSSNVSKQNKINKIVEWLKAMGKNNSEINAIIRGKIDLSSGVSPITLKKGDKVFRFERIMGDIESEKHFFTNADAADAGVKSVGFSNPHGYQLVTYEVLENTEVLKTKMNTNYTQYISDRLQNNIKVVAIESAY